VVKPRVSGPVSSPECRAQSVGPRVSGPECRAQSVGPRVSGPVSSLEFAGQRKKNTDNTDISIFFAIVFCKICLILLQNLLFSNDAKQLRYNSSGARYFQ
jgi:hypothetical protein